MKLDSRVRSALTLVTLLLILGFGAKWGWSAATKALPETAPATTGPCRSLEVAAGTKVTPQDVVVSVFNGSDRAGLAQRTLGLFGDDGFGKGQAKDAPKNSGVEIAEIWTANPEDPAVLLVASRLKGVDILEGPQLGPGVVVLVGEKFDSGEGKPFIVSKADAEICAPVPTESPSP